MSKVRRDPHNIRRNIALNGKYISNDGDSEGILVGDGGIVTVSSALSIKESSSPVNHLDTYGRLWVNNTDPTALYFTNDDGDDIQLTSGAAAIGTISLAADRISVGDAQVNIATSSGDIVFKSNGNSGTDEWLRFNTDDTTDGGNLPVSEILGVNNQRIRIRGQGTEQDLQIFSGKNWDGRKTDDFYNNLMIHIDPSRAGPVTGDIWMLRAFGFAKANEMPSPKQDEFMTKETQRIISKE